jgi:hypothetical protein
VNKQHEGDLKCSQRKRRHAASPSPEMIQSEQSSNHKQRSQTFPDQEIQHRVRGKLDQPITNWILLFDAFSINVDQ